MPASVLTCIRAHATFPTGGAFFCLASRPARYFRSPANARLQSILACNVAELEGLARNSPRFPAVREGRRSTKKRQSDVAVHHNLSGVACSPLSENRARACEWIPAINAIVPRGMPDHRRDDIKQGTFLLMLDGTAPDPRSAVREATRRYYKIHNKWRTCSLDTPIRGNDGLTYHDVMEDTEGEDDE
jgi:hypothetical protein